MADKEATVYIVDVGRSMGERNGGRDETDLDWALTYVWDKITTTVMTGRKTAHIGVIGLRTKETENPLSEDDAYWNISVLAPLGQMLMPTIRDLRDKLTPSKTDKGDAISALVLAIQMIAEHCRKLKYSRRIVLVTNGKGNMDTDGVEQITSKVKEDNIELTVLGIDFDDPDYGFKEEGKSRTKAANEKILENMVNDCDGMFGTMEQAVKETSIPRLKTTRPVPSYKGLLMLGDPEKYDTAMSIDVERYPRVMVAKPPTASSFVAKTEFGGGDASTQSSTTLQDGGTVELPDRTQDQNGLTGIKTTRIYQVQDDTAPNGKKDVEMDELAKGYEYGRTAVHISESERNIVNLETQPGLEIIGFVPWENYDRYMNMSRSNIIIPQKANEKASMALSSFIHALFETESYAIARFVPKEGKNPIILLLAPSIETDYECLLDVELPFAEDIRNYRFPPLDKVITVSGKTLFKHRSLPGDDLTQAMSDYVDSMDLSTFGRDENGNPADYAPMDETYSPILHRISQAIRWRAAHPTEPVPPPSEMLTKYSHPPEELVSKAKPHLTKVLAAADIKKVPPKQHGRKRGRDVEKPLSGLDVEGLLGRDAKRGTTISADNAIPEFKQMLATSEDLGVITEGARQMAGVVRDKIRHSTGDSGYGAALECIRVMREEMTELEEPGIFNEFVRDLKRRIGEGELGEERKEMWWRIRANRLGLIDKKLSPFSDATEEDAKKFLALK